MQQNFQQTITFQEFCTRIVNLMRFITADIAKIYSVISKNGGTPPSSIPPSYEPEFSRICDNTKKLVVLLRDNFATKDGLNPAQLLVLDSTKELSKLILRFSQIIRRVPVDAVRAEIDSIYDRVFDNTKDLVAAINVILKGAFLYPHFSSPHAPLSLLSLSLPFFLFIILGACN